MSQKGIKGALATVKAPQEPFLVGIKIVRQDRKVVMLEAGKGEREGLGRRWRRSTAS